ncbi:MAG: ChaN family lipoprotein [Limnothrix sp. RL_2_0]|nr:ChaN family lipoprotein [Limnothrix sp. RL_2_0]
MKFLVVIFTTLLFLTTPFFSALANTESATIEVLEQGKITYLGEIHDNPLDHEKELEILIDLYSENQDLALGFEMFQRPFQPYLDRFIAGEISETELRELTEYGDRWGYDWEFYAPLFRFAQAHHLPLIALNTPSEIINKVATDSLDSLEPQDYRYIPNRSDLDFSNKDYLAEIEESFREHLENNYGKSQNPENFVVAQILWDETMAQRSPTIQTCIQSQKY